MLVKGARRHPADRARTRQGRYDRVHSGASCRPSRLRTLVALLRPGGLLVPPRACRCRPARRLYGGVSR
jgi:hypothetical protein